MLSAQKTQPQRKKQSPSSSHLPHREKGETSSTFLPGETEAWKEGVISQRLWCTLPKRQWSRLHLSNFLCFGPCNDIALRETGLLHFYAAMGWRGVTMAQPSRAAELHILVQHGLHAPAMAGPSPCQRDSQGGIPSRAPPALPKLLDSAADPLHGTILRDLHASLHTMLPKPLGCRSQVALPAQFNPCCAFIPDFPSFLGGLWLRWGLPIPDDCTDEYGMSPRKGMCLWDHSSWLLLAHQECAHTTA